MDNKTKLTTASVLMLAMAACSTTEGPNGDDRAALDMDTGLDATLDGPDNGNVGIGLQAGVAGDANNDGEGTGVAGGGQISIGKQRKANGEDEFGVRADGNMAAGETDSPDAPTTIDNRSSVDFDRLDRNRDGVISSSEAQSDEMLTRNFGHADKDSDGQIALSEYKKYLENRPL